uniref:Uncharacterized protein n=1 Tax=Glossina austeni TaxID=7395 RepID=A0A1A9UWB8_GLOAU
MSCDFISSYEFILESSKSPCFRCWPFVEGFGTSEKLNLGESLDQRRGQTFSPNNCLIRSVKKKQSEKAKQGKGKDFTSPCRYILYEYLIIFVIDIGIVIVFLQLDFAAIPVLLHSIQYELRIRIKCWHIFYAQLNIEKLNKGFPWPVGVEEKSEVPTCLPGQLNLVCLQSVKINPGRRFDVTCILNLASIRKY